MTGLSVLQIGAMVKLHSTCRTSRTESLSGCQGDVRAKNTMSCVQKTPWTWQMWLSELWLRGKNLSLLQRHLSQLSQLSQLFRKRPWLNPYHSYVKSVRYRWDTMRHLFFHLFSSTYILVRSFGRWNLESIQCCLQMYPQHGYMWQLYPSLVPWPIRQRLNAIHYIHQSGCSWPASRKMKIDPPHRGGKEGKRWNYEFHWFCLRPSCLSFYRMFHFTSCTSFTLLNLIQLAHSLASKIEVSGQVFDLHVKQSGNQTSGIPCAVTWHRVILWRQKQRLWHAGLGMRQVTGQQKGLRSTRSGRW